MDNQNDSVGPFLPYIRPFDNSDEKETKTFDLVSKMRMVSLNMMSNGSIDSVECSEIMNTGRVYKHDPE